MRRFKSLLSSVISATIAFTTLAMAALFSSRTTDGADLSSETGTPSERSTQDRRLRRFHAVPLVAVLAVGATAFAAGAGTPSNAEPIAVGDQVPHTSRTVETATESTLPGTAEAVAASVDAKNEANVRVMKAIAKSDAEAAAAADAKAAAEAKARAERTAAAAAAPVASAPVSVSGACGGSLPPCCVMMRESGGSPTAVNPSSGASGKWQFMTATWANYRGYPTAASAPESVQDERAVQLWAGGAGAGHWGGGCW